MSAVLGIALKLGNSFDNDKTPASKLLGKVKVLDVVNHKIILVKQDHYGVRRLANDRFKSSRKEPISLMICNITLGY